MVRAHVLPSTLFIAFWVVLGLGVFFIAARGGLAGARAPFQRQSRGARRAAGLTFTLLYIGFGIAQPVVFLIGNHANANGQVSGIKLNAAEKRGRELFYQHCGICHTLAAASTNGKVGPNLDTIRPSESLVLHTINNGCLQNPPSANSPETCLGQGTMPAAILQGQDAQNVAKFVAKVAGRD
jgi:mono/diheme cytochrome c family protein